MANTREMVEKESAVSGKKAGPQRETAESMAGKQKEIAVSEFFAKNRHLLGFDNPRKALLTTVKEAVDNSLDACEEGQHPAGDLGEDRGPQRRRSPRTLRKPRPTPGRGGRKAGQTKKDETQPSLHRSDQPGDGRSRSRRRSPTPRGFAVTVRDNGPGIVRRRSPTSSAGCCTAASSTACA